MKKFRIKVDLSAFFDDERKLAHILVDPAWESVKSLQQRVEQIFEVDNVRFITNEGCFVPPQEPILVIKTSDVLRAFIPADDMKKKRKKDKSYNEVSVNYGEKVKKRKRELVSKETLFTSSTPNNAKRSKSVMPFSATIKNSTVDEITSTSEQLGLKYENQKQGNTNLGTNVEELEAPSIVVNDASCQKKMSPVPERSEVTKKRRRKNKNKNNQSLTKNNETVDDSENLILGGTDDAAPTKSITCNKLRSCSGLPASSLRNQSKQKIIQSGHSYFDDTGETVSTTTENEANEIPTKIIFRCPVSEVSYDKPRVFSLKKTVPTSLETEKTAPQATPETKETQSDVVVESARIKSRSPVIIQELLIIPSVDPSVENKINEESSNVNETVCNEMEKSISNNIELNEQETTTTKDDSSVIAIESENDDESEEENDKNGSDEQDEGVSEIIDLNASDDESQQSTIIVNVGNQTADGPGEKLSIDEMLPFSIVLEALPVPDEIIIFKLYRLDGKRSGFIAGKCRYINKRTKTLKLVVIDGQKEISGIPNKYICSLDDSTATDKQYLQVKYNDLLDAKLFSLN